MIGVASLPREQDAETAIAEPPTLSGQLAQPRPQRLVAADFLLVLERRPIQTRQAARPTLAYRMVLHRLDHRAALHVGRQ